MSRLSVLQNLLNIYFEGTYKEIDDKGVKKKCLPGCNDQSYSTLLSDTVYPAPTNFMWDKNFCVIVKKLRRTCLSERKDFLGKH